ncbi:MAG: hypothetical protein A3J66_00465 [Candidatus Magasanikbacteria bacterium RIFCSPHIGHO2_02_FULL_47_14]|uniref:Uncharacterized protein n=1 Tax=Candidatus Magasanikbacteria bacterium RIFCSPHIGHO2_02_FULL_47_14 TaxID=1798680 RepID=A0A1F6MBE7_9BACT|nr:MAG: hypothetical protein A3J66_00465 [Candidatus Magasanikbacteria bacterium RIFCSPHIGHO2_02_FULL_47_14]
MTYKGFSLVEVLLSSALFAIIVTGFLIAIAYSQQSIDVTGDRVRALFLAEQGVEAVRSIRDNQFESLPADGTYGLQASTGTWQLTGVSDTIDEFTRSITLSSIDADTKEVASVVTWQQTLQRSGSIRVVSRLTNWQAVTTIQSDFLTADVSAATTGGSGKSEILGIELGNSGDTDIVIDRITVDWTTPNQNIREISIENTIVWSSDGPGTPVNNQPTGTELNIQDYTIPAGEDDVDVTRLWYTGNISGNNVTITFMFQDGSTKSVNMTL